MKILWRLFSLTLAHCSTTAFATSVQPLFYVGAELGIPFGSDQAGYLSQMLVSRLGGSASVADSNVVALGRLFGGYKVLENLDIEVGAYQTGKSSLQFTGAVNTFPFRYSGVARNSADGINYTVLFRPNLVSGWNRAFFRLGGHWSRLETTTIIRTFSATTKDSGSGLVYGVGYDGVINETMNWRLQMTRTNNVAGKSGFNTYVMSIGILKSF